MLIFIKWKKTSTDKFHLFFPEEEIFGFCSSSNSMDESSLLIHFEREYNLKIREEFDIIENEITELIKQKRQNYQEIAKLIE
jgi:hypothetical protein